MNKAAVWYTTGGGDTYDLQLPPTPPDDPSVANGITAATCVGGTQTFVAVGSTLTPEMPAAWSCVVTGCATATPVMGPWVVESIPIPAGATTGIAMDVEYELTADETTAVGSFVTSDGFRKATIWTRNAEGIWSFALLPDGGAGTNSQALGIGSSGDDGIDVEIVGGADNPEGNMMPALWKETSPGSGMFIFATMLHVDGVLSGVLSLYDEGDLYYFVGGTVELYDGTKCGVAYRTADQITWESVGYACLPGYGNCTLDSFAGTRAGGLVVVFSGTSYNTDPLVDGLATSYRMVNTAQTFALERIVDVNQLIIVGAPGNSRIVLQFGFTPSAPAPPELSMGIIVDDAPARAAIAGPALPHAYGFEEQPAVDPTIPAVSEWGMVAMVLLVLCVATIVIARCPKPAATWHAIVTEAARSSRWRRDAGMRLRRGRF